MVGHDRVEPASDYDEFVDWDARLRREGPFFRRLFAEHGVKSVIDVGAGSARHAILFASWGLDVVAVDPDPSMLAQAERNLAAAVDRIESASGSLRLVEGGFGGLERLALGPADAITCTGNALPHVAGRHGLDEALADFSAVLREGGVLVLHLLNHARLLDARLRVVPPKVRETAEGTKVFLRVIDYPAGGESLDFDFVTLLRDHDGVWSVTDRRSAHTAIPIDVLREALAAAGFKGVVAYGDHTGRALEVATDESVIVVAHRG